MSENSASRRDVLRIASAAALGSVAVDSVHGRTAQVATEIADWNDLATVRDDLEGDYVLVSDLDEETAGYDTHVADPESGWDPIGNTVGSNQFTGTFSGNGYTIDDLRIDRRGEEGIGLFGLNQGTVEGVAIANCDVSGDNNVGSLVGINAGGTVSECSAGGTVSGVTHIGGLVGQINDGGTVRRSSTGGDITAEEDAGGLVGLVEDGGTVTVCSSSSSVSGSDAGGLVARAGGTVNKAYATGDVVGTDAGGLVGVNRGGTVSVTYAVGEVSDDGSDLTNIGGIAGFVDPVFESETKGYWNTESTGQQDGVGSGDADVTGLTTTEMRGSVVETELTTFDFDGVWTITDGYPVFEFQNGSVESYASDDSGTVDASGLMEAIDDWQSGKLRIALLRDVVDAWKTRDDVR